MKINVVRIIHGVAEICYSSAGVQAGISQLNAANE